MNLLELCNLQGSLFLMILAGAVLKRRGIISKEGEKCLTDLCVNIVIPCNIVKSCLISFDASIFKTCGLLLAVGFVLQLVCVALNKVLFKGIFRAAPEGASILYDRFQRRIPRKPGCGRRIWKYGTSLRIHFPDSDARCHVVGGYILFCWRRF